MTPEERAYELAKILNEDYLPANVKHHLHPLLCTNELAVITDAIRAAVEAERAKYTRLVEAADRLERFYPNQDMHDESLLDAYRAARRELP